MRSLMVVFAAIGWVAGSSLGVVDITLKAKVGSTTYVGTVPATAYSPGIPIEIQVWAQNPVSAVLGVGGDIVASGPVSFSTPTQGATWVAKSHVYPMLDATGTATGQSVTIYDPKGSFCGMLPNANITCGDYVTTGDTFDGYTFPDTATVAQEAAPGTKVTPTLISATGFNIGGIPQANGGMADLGSGQAIRIPLDDSFGKTAAVMVCSYTITWTSLGATTLNWVDSGLADSFPHGGWFTAGISVGDYVGTISNLTFLPEPLTLSLFALGGLLVARRPARNR